MSGFAQSFEVFEGDTINIVNSEDQKTGKWVFFYPESELIHQLGEYINGQKEGLWKCYYPSGVLKSEITYSGDEKKGYAAVYYENGKLAEEGTWDKDKWVGTYTYFYKNGALSYAWNFNESGARSGYQRYYYENGQVKIEGEWVNGKESGIIKEYYESGALKSEKNFEYGSLDENAITMFRDKELAKETDIELVQDSLVVAKKDTVKVFDGNGYYIFYNKFKEVEKEGYFTDGVLMEGKQYIYNEKGDLQKTITIKNGQVSKD
jgi:antitoxin component YwqK of YwqJK toxin-antitoxin module